MKETPAIKLISIFLVVMCSTLLLVAFLQRQPAQCVERKEIRAALDERDAAIFELIKQVDKIKAALEFDPLEPNILEESKSK